MAVVLLDLGNSLIDDDNRPSAGVIELLEWLTRIKDGEGEPVQIGLLSNVKKPVDPSERSAIVQRYYATLREAKIDHFLQPLEQKVTLSAEVEARSPDARLFQAALRKLGPGADVHQTLFVTADGGHAVAARQQGMMSIHVDGNGDTSGEAAGLLDIVPIVARLMKYAPCCKKHGEAKGKYESVAGPSRKRDAATQELVEKVSAARIKQRVDRLVAFGTRWTMSDNGPAITDWLKGEFLAIGYANDMVRYQPFAVPGASPQRNVLCGADRDSAGMVLIGAHYDSVSETPATFAPGADDNASGVAVMLEVAQLLHSMPLKRGVLFAAFGGEEQGLFGSAECARVAAAEEWKIDLVINLDMIAYQDPAKLRQVVVEYDQGNRNPSNDAAAKAFGLQMAQAAADYTNLFVQHSDIWNSDYIPFEERGYPCIGLYEASENPGYHKTQDVTQSLDMSHLNEIAKLVVASVHQIAC